MSHIATSDLVRCADGHAVAGLGAEVALLLNDYYDAIAWGMSVHGLLPFLLLRLDMVVPYGICKRTDFRSALRSQDIDALDYGGARVVDAIDEGLDCMHEWLH
jgi:hypothetical protein